MAQVERIQRTGIKYTGAQWAFCPWCGRHLTKYALDGASALSAEPDSGLESVPANEAGSQPRKQYSRWAEARRKAVKRICINPKCGWVGKEADCMDYKHPVGARLCPECYEVTEEIRPTKREPDASPCTCMAQ